MKYSFKKITALISVVISICIFLPITGCNQVLSDPVSVTGYKLNTYVTIQLYSTGGHSTKELKSILDEALGKCDYYENIFSRTKKGSELYRVNNHETTRISKELYELISLGIQYGYISGGALDITIGSVSSLWDFTADKPELPDSEQLTSALDYVNYKNISLTKIDEDTYEISIPEGYILDLGAIAKGYIADKIKDFLLENNIDRAIINLGGNVLCIGSKNASTDFNIGIKKPFTENSILTTLKLNNMSAVSSGNYERYFYENDKLYHHILNPKTGYPYENGLTNVTILSDLSVAGDCLSTTCFALGLDDGLKLIEETDGVEAMFVTMDGEITYSTGFSKYLAQ